MAVVVPDKFVVQFYDSKNLTEWTKTGEFGHVGDTLRIWECPDIFPLTVENESKTKWVLSLSGSHPQGPKFVGMQYFVGTFDGKKFSADEPKPAPAYVNYGKDFYAGIVYNQLPLDQKRTVMIGWVNNWTYANEIPAAEWRGAMSIPRELSLRKFKEGYKLIQKPIRELSSLRSDEIKNPKEIDLPFELDIEIEGKGIGGIVLGSDSSHCLRIGFNFRDSKIFLDRTNLSDSNFSPDFATIDSANYYQRNRYTDLVHFELTRKIKLKIIFDTYITEVFSEDGEVSITDLTFHRGKLKLTTFGDKAEVRVKGWKLK
jgi:fructan beta-fructosidase